LLGDDGAGILGAMGDTIRIQDARFAWRAGAPPVLDGVTLAVREGEVLGIVGPNGAGKSTLLGLMSGVLRPASGSVRLGDREVSAMPRRDVARRVAVVPQSEVAAFPFAVEDAVMMGRTPHLRGALALEGEADRAAVRAAMETAGIAHLAGRAATELSGGERQLVLLARAVAQDAPIWLMDEPTASLDLAHQQAVLRLIARENRERGRTIVLVAHDLNLAAAACERIAVLAQGRVVAEGAPAEVVTEDAIRRVWGADVWVGAGPEGRPTVMVRGDR